MIRINNSLITGSGGSCRPTDRGGDEGHTGARGLLTPFILSTCVVCRTGASTIRETILTCFPPQTKRDYNNKTLASSVLEEYDKTLYDRILSRLFTPF